MARRAAPLAATLAALALLAAGCGEEDEEAGGGAELAGLVPPDAPIYAEALIRPEGEQRERLEATLGALLATDDPGGAIVDELDEEAARSGGPTSFSEDVLPKLGERAAFFASDFDRRGGEPSYAAVIESPEPEALLATVRDGLEARGIALAERSYAGADYIFEDDGQGFPATGILDGRLVTGSEEGFRAAVDVAEGDSAPDATALPEDFDHLGAEAVLAFHADLGKVLDELEAAGELEPQERAAAELQLGVGTDAPISGWAGAAESSLVGQVSAAAGSAPGGAPELFSSLPADSWLAFGAGELGASIEAALEGFSAQLEAAESVPPKLEGGFEGLLSRELGLRSEELTSWLGDAGLYVRGTSIFGLGGALIVETSDEGATLAALGRVQARLEEMPELAIEPLDVEGDGFEVAFVGAPVRISVVLRDGRLVAGLGTDSVEEALEPDATLSGSDSFANVTEALGEGFEPSFLLELGPLVELVEGTGQTVGDPDYAEAKPYLDALDFIAFGQQLDGERETSRFVVAVDEAGE